MVNPKIIDHPRKIHHVDSDAVAKDMEGGSSPLETSEHEQEEQHDIHHKHEHVHHHYHHYSEEK